jgi:hypothetical protein
MNNVEYSGVHCGGSDRVIWVVGFGINIGANAQGTEGRMKVCNFLALARTKSKSTGIPRANLNRAYIVRDKLQDSVLGKYRDNQLHSRRRIMVDER